MIKENYIHGVLGQQYIEGNNNIHNIRFINQDLTLSKFINPFGKYLLNGIDVGLFGSLQSYPPIKNKNYKFYLPDTFSPSPKAYPKPLSEFQKLIRYQAQIKQVEISKIILKML